MERRLGLTKRDRITLLALAAICAAGAGYELAVTRYASSPVPSGTEAAVRIDINSAGRQRLTLLPGIGKKTARIIVNDREANGRYISVEDLSRVKGIGPTVIRRIGPHAVCR